MMRGILPMPGKGMMRRRSSPSLGEMISAMVDSFSGRRIDPDTVGMPLRFMHDSGMLEDSTMDLLRPLLSTRDLWASDFLEDGRVRYASNSVPWDECEDIGDAETVCFDPVKTVSWVVKLLQNDRKFRARLGFCPRDLDELIGAASEIGTGGYSEYCSSLSRIRGPKALCGDDIVFFFTDEGSSRTLCFDRPGNFRYSSGLMGSEEVSKGMAGEIVRSGSDLYFRYNDACAYLHIDLKTGEQEILQCIRIIGAAPRGGIVYRDLEENSLCFMKEGACVTLLKEAENTGCRLEDDHIIVCSSDGGMLPRRLDYSGKAGPASPGEISAVFWSTLMSLAGSRSYAMSLSENRAGWELLREAESRSLCLKDMNAVFSMAFERKMFSGRGAFPFRDILRLIESLGVDPEEDISARMFTLFHYNYLCGRGRFIDRPDTFTRSFCGLLEKLSRRPRFWEMLAAEPEKLFGKRVKETEKENFDIFDLVMGESDLIGRVTLLDDGSLRVVKRSKDLGRVIGNELSLPEDENAPKEGISGRVSFDLVKGDYAFFWPSPDDELVKKVGALFMHNTVLRTVDTDAPVTLPFSEEAELEELRRMLLMGI